MPKPLKEYKWIKGGWGTDQLMNIVNEHAKRGWTIVSFTPEGFGHGMLMEKDKD